MTTPVLGNLVDGRCTTGAGGNFIDVRDPAAALLRQRVKTVAMGFGGGAR